MHLGLGYQQYICHKCLHILLFNVKKIYTYAHHDSTLYHHLTSDLQRRLIVTAAVRSALCVAQVYLDIACSTLRRLKVHWHKGMYHDRLKFRDQLLLEF